MIPSPKRRSSIVLVWFLVMLGGVASADTMTDARKLLDRANQEYNVGDFHAAILNYKEAYRLTRHSSLIFNIAQCHRKLGQYAEAIHLYNNYLVEQPNATNRAVVEELIEESTKALEDQQRRGQAAREAEAMAEAQRAAAERHRAEAERAEREHRLREENARRQREEAERLALAKEAARYNRHPGRPFAYASAGVGIVALGTGGFFGFSARAAQSKFDEAKCGDPLAPLTQVELAMCRKHRDDGNRAALLSNILFAAGAATTIGAVVIYLVDPGNITAPSTRRTRVNVSPDGVTLTVSF